MVEMSNEEYWAQQRKLRYSDRDYHKHKFCLLEGLSEPAAIFIGVKGLTSGIREVNGYNFARIQATVDRLRDKQIDAVPVYSPLAADPSKTVVTAGGIQTPVLALDKIEEAAKQIYDALGVNPGDVSFDFSLASPVQFEQMAEVSATSQTVAHTVIDAGMLHPDVDSFVADREKFGFDLEYQLIKEAEASDKLISIETLREANETELTKLYRGGCLGDTPYLSLASRESKNFAYSTPDIQTATRYSGIGGDYGAGMEAFSENDPDGVRFGFVYEFDAGKNVCLFNDYGIESGGKARVNKNAKDITRSDWEDMDFETPVVPSKNKLTNVYLHIKKEGQDMFYPIDRNDERWAAMLRMYRTTDTTKRGYMIERRRQTLDDKKVYSSLNNNKRLGLFTKKVEPMDFGACSEEVLKAANMTVEELVQPKGGNKRQRQTYTPEEIEAKLARVRQQMQKPQVSQSVKPEAPAPTQSVATVTPKTTVYKKGGTGIGL